MVRVSDVYGGVRDHNRVNRSVLRRQRTCFDFLWMKGESVMKPINERSARAALVILLIALMLSACAPQAPVSEKPTAAPGGQPSTPITDRGVAPAAATLARQTLAAALGVSEAEITITDVKPMQWRNGCLELEQPGEMCTQVIVPGYQVMLEAGGQPYEYRTNMTGSVVRPAVATTMNPALRAAQETLATSLGKSAAEVKVVAVEPVTWRDGCLEVYQAGTACTEALVPGFRVTLDVGGETHEVRTNQDGTVSVVAPRSETVLTWHREGGIAGFCDDLSMTSAGAITGRSCKGNQTEGAMRTSLDADQQAQLQTWLAQFAPVDYQMKDPAQADAMLQTLTFKGQGQSKATPADINALLAWVNEVYSSLKSTLAPSGSKLTPTLQAQPSSGALQSLVKLHGENWPLGKKVNIHLASASVPFDAAQVYAATVVGGFGAFDVSVTVPAAWPNGAAVSESALTWIASTPDGMIKATADFTVTP